MKRLLAMLGILGVLFACRAKPVVLEVVPEPTAKVGVKQSVAALSATETSYNATAFYVGVLRDIVDKKRGNVFLFDGRLLQYRDGVCTTTFIGLGVYPPPMPLRGDLNQDGKCNLLDILILVDKILGRT